MNKSKFKTGLWIILAILILAIMVIISNPFAINENVQSGSFIGVPTYGYIECGLSKQGIVTTPPTDYFKFSSYSFNCNQFTGNTLIQECDVTLKTPSKSEMTDLNEYLLYGICSTPNCDVSSQNLIWLKQVTNPFIPDSVYDKLITVHLKKGEYLKVVYQVNTLTQTGVAKTKGYAKMTFVPYTLYRYDIFSTSNGEMIPNTQDCANGNYLSERNYLIESINGGGKLSTELQKTSIDMNNIRSNGARVIYLSNFVGVIPQYQFFDSDTKYCYDKKVYNVETIIVSSGKTFKVANTGTNAQLYSVDCCNTADAISTKGSGYYCKDFKITPLSTSTGSECSTLNPCPIVGYQALAGKQVVSQSCQNGVCQSTFKSVACNYVFDCPNGYCSIDSQNPQNNKCITTIPQNFCGNGVCEASYNENEKTCAKDCSIKQTQNLTTIYIILAFLIALVLMLIVAMYRRK